MKHLYIVLPAILILCTFCTLQGTTTKPISSDVQIDSIYVAKSSRILVAFSKHKKIKIYTISLGFEPVGKKHFEGDGKTPEGLYYISSKSAVSQFHKNLHISYPNRSDINFAQSKGKQAGGDIKIHGLPNQATAIQRYIQTDWTLGCIALTNEDIDELFEHIKMGSPILIEP